MTARVKEFANQIIEETEARVRKEIEIETKYKIAAKFIKRGYDTNKVATTLNLTSSDMAIIQSEYFA